MTLPLPCGSWPSPINAEMLASKAIFVGAPHMANHVVTWLERRPTEGGRSVIVRLGADGARQDLLSKPFNARTRVHEYGGGGYLPTPRGVLFSNFDDQRLYLIEDGAEPRALTGEGYRYADPCSDAQGRRIYLVEEDHTGEGEAKNRIVCLDLDAEQVGRTVVVEGNDFYASPRLSACGTRLAWITWNHPNMPWDHTELWVAHLTTTGKVEITERVAGHEGESAGEPTWAPDRTLYYVTDRTGFWNLHRWTSGSAECVYRREADFSKPHWGFANSSFAFAGPERLLCSWTERGTWHLGLLDPATKELDELDLPYTQFDSVHANATHAVFSAASPTALGAIVRLEFSSGEVEVLRRASEEELAPGCLSAPEAIEFPTAGGLTSHGLFYAPKSLEHSVPTGERPPLLVFTHGGPTGCTSSSLRLGIQYWTSRGFAVLDVNYGGSSGYGREYRERLKGTWGVTDVVDCERGAQFLVERGDVDGERLAIRGGSAGGYTTLCALTFGDTFKAGASHFGVCDLEALAKDTHKFESRYLDGLIGPYPERRDLYEKRSPIHYTDRLNCPVILLQGLEDKVVPPNQAEMMVDALKAKGIPVAYVPFEGEQHGFRKAANIKRAQEAELYFYAKVFGFETADTIEPVEITGL